ncbi:hypothetical protein KKF81_03100 [Candidatus Micrarchaeota archaeon]|nr:hypothetical protein [Candidatus Micrarchaeota archaeon]MBU1165910.1 hypothetical protein [Candidatus Micrarchaeota archaeon]MBU1886791.1 hypothetical protein [Candidatus Micrarchaeota archaeon]
MEKLFDINVGVMMKTKFVLLILALLGLSFASLSISDWSVSSDSFNPGASGILTIEISNPCTSSGAVVSCSGIVSVNSVTVDVNAPSQIVMTGRQNVGDLEAGGSTTISLPFKVSSSANSAIYQVEIVLSGFSSSSSTGGGYDSFSRRLTVPITVAKHPVLDISIDKQVIGGVDDVVVTITNQGGNASDVYLSIDSESDVAFYGSDKVYVPNAGQSVSVDVTIDSRDAFDGPTNIPFIIDYRDELGISHQDELSMRITVRNKKLDLDFLQQSDIITRHEGTLTLRVRNDGEETLKDVRLTFSDSSLRFVDTNEFKFGDVAPGEFKSASVIVFPDLTPGVNIMEATVTWIEKEVQKDEKRNVPVTVTSDADVGVYLEAKPLPLTVGSEHTISVLVSNLGSYSIENVEVSLSSPVLSLLDISDRQYIGGLQQDDFSTVQFLMKVNATEAGTYPATVIVNYRDQSGEWKQKVIEKNIMVSQSAQSDVNPLPLLAVLGVIAVGIWYFKFRKKPAKPNGSR